MRQARRMRGRNYSKSSTYTESLKVYVTGISRKGLRITRGDLSSRTNYHRRETMKTEVSRWHSRLESSKPKARTRNVERNLKVSMNGKDVEISNEKSKSCLAGSGRNLREARRCERPPITATEEPIQNTASLIEAMLERENMLKAYKQVVRNKGAPGVNGMTTEDLKDYLKEHWLQLRDEVLSGRYRPSPVKEVEIPKPGGGVRKLGIPTVVDRLLQQAIHQILSPIFEIGFSESSYGFRPGRGAHQAVQKAKEIYC